MANLILTPEWTEGIYQLETSDLIIGGPDGVDNRQAIQLGKRTEWLKEEVEKRAPNTSPAFTGTPTAPTAPQTVNNGQIATTAFVKAAIAALVGSAPATLDTLAEIATALGADGNLKQTLLNEIGKKANSEQFISYLDSQIGIIQLCPTASIPVINISGYTYISVNGQAFDKSRYPKLAKIYPSGVLPDPRGEFPRFWDNGRGVDAGRALLSAQGDAIRNITGWMQIAGISGTDAILRNSGGVFSHDGEAAYGDNTGQILGTGTTSYMDTMRFDASKLVPTAFENRPRNIAFQAICLAA